MRRQRSIGTTVLGIAGAELTVGAGAQVALEMAGTSAEQGGRKRFRVFLWGDVMTGRGIDQILPHPSATEMPVFRSLRFHLRNAVAEDVGWLAGELDRQTGKLGSARVVANERGLRLQWS